MKRIYDVLSLKAHWVYVMLYQCERYISVNSSVLSRICLRVKVGNLVFTTCSLVVRMDCVADKSKGG